MPDGTIHAPGEPAAVRRVTVINATGTDQNFGLLAQPGPVEIAPDTGATSVLAWMIALVPGRSASVTSRYRFEWVERRALMLGRFGRGGRFVAEAVLPVSPTTKALHVGFVGTPDNGAAKLLQVEAGSEAATALSTDQSFPPLSDRMGATRGLSVAVSIDPGNDLDGAALAVPLASNMVMTVAWRLQYWLVSLPIASPTGSVITAEALALAHAVAFDARDAVTVRFTDKNVFEDVT